MRACVFQGEEKNCQFFDMANTNRYSTRDTFEKLVQPIATMKCRSAVYIGVEILLFVINVVLFVNVILICTPDDPRCIKSTAVDTLISPSSGRLPSVWLPDLQMVQMVRYVVVLSVLFIFFFSFIRV